jgi:3-oxoacyl-[acyl-carrier protein] reductase
MDLKLAGKVVLITGSSRGIGLATAKAFVAEGCRIMLSARSAAQLCDVEAALRAAGAAVAAHAGDVGNPADAARLIDATAAAFGGIDVLVNNVGGGGGGARVAGSSDDDWRGALERNLIQTVRMMRLALPHMKGRPGAAVINIASISGWRPQLAMSRQYGAAKAALIFDTERWALEFVPHGLRVNTVSPGSILVEGNGWDRYRLANPDYFDDYVRHGFPMGRLDTAEEVADVIVFLASPRAHWINGRNIPVGAAACTARPPAVLGPPPPAGRGIDITPGAGQAPDRGGARGNGRCRFQSGGLWRWRPAWPTTSVAWRLSRRRATPH